MAVRGVLRAGEVCVRVMDMAAAREHYDNRVGLIETAREDDERTYYKCWDEHDAHSLVLQRAESPGVAYVAFKVLDDATLSEYEQRLEAHGLKVSHVAAGVHPRSGRRIQFRLPSGHLFQLYAEKEKVGNGMSNRNPGTLPDDGYIRGMKPIRLDHVLLGGGKLDEVHDLFTKVLDFTVSEKLVHHETGALLAVFFTASNKPHDIAFVLQPNDAKFHHVSFLLESVSDLFSAADRIGKFGIPVDVGPTRHGVTRGATIYFFDPSGNRNEVFCGGYVHYPDTPTLVWDTSRMGQATFSQDNTPRESFLSVLT